MKQVKFVYGRPNVEEEQRRFKRVDARDLRQIFVKVLNIKIKERDYSLYDISIGGFCLKCNKKSFDKINKQGHINVEINDRKSSYLRTAVKRWSRYQDSFGLIGFEFVFINLHDKGNDRISFENLVEGETFIDLREKISVSATYSRNYFYSELEIQHIIGISQSYLISEVNETENIFLEGQMIDLFLYGMNQEHKVQVEVARLLQVSKQKITLLLKKVHFPEDTMRYLANRIMLSGKFTLEDFSHANIPLKEVASCYKVRSICTSKEYEEVLHLRYKAYKDVGKSISDDPFDLVSPLDQKSRILGCYEGGKLVASVTVTFPDEGDVLDTEAPLKNGYGENFPPKADLLEISRLCIDPEYRSTDILMRIFEHLYFMHRYSGRKYIVTSCEDKLWPLYKAMGAKKSGMSYEHPYFKGIQHHILLIDINTPVGASGISIVNWHYFYYKANKFLQDQKLVNLDTILELEAKAMDLLGPRIKNFFMRRRKK